MYSTEGVAAVHINVGITQAGTRALLLLRQPGTRLIKGGLVVVVVVVGKHCYQAEVIVFSLFMLRFSRFFFLLKTVAIHD